MSGFEKFCFAFILAIGIILIAAVASKISHKNGYKQGYADALASIKPDTVWRDTTIYEEKPVPEYHYRDTGRIVYIPVPVPDTTGHPDTTLVPMHPEVKYYADNENYELQISGILPNLDWIKVHQKTAYITVPVPEYKYPSFAFSMSAKSIVFPGTLFFGVGMEADLWRGRWQFSVEGGYGCRFANGINTPGMYGDASLKYNLIRK